MQKLMYKQLIKYAVNIHKTEDKLHKIYMTRFTLLSFQALLSF